MGELLRSARLRGPLLDEANGDASDVKVLRKLPSRRREFSSVRGEYDDG